ncbi:hypothetical protein VHA01S_085_00140 [Vibrio halioticoli NBRC 102217]|uniref:Uncharacterized protein n=1 Tax=Vibrio halioticoli NBRC 102217 TaxID=1219072 RepID=V5FRS9_9VIBR|nr:hypothetical protein [Vibrio halioticoli]GAD91337.1 hypothetical protein VHA01S_085_00140 [Vibrio halioticoli NBRC 102217]
MNTFTLEVDKNHRMVGFFKTVTSEDTEQQYAIEITFDGKGVSALLKDNMPVRIEVLKVLFPKNLCFCEFEDIKSCQSQDVPEHLRNILWSYGVVQDTPLDIQVEINGQKHSFVVTNSDVSI